MAKVTTKRIAVQPRFDMLYYMQLAGLNRVEQALLDSLRERWDRWVKDKIHAYKMTPEFGGDKGYLLVFLDKDVEEEVEETWQKTPKQGMATHNLAICLAMSAAHSVVPELDGGACAPLPTPDKAMRKAFGRLGLEWDPSGCVNRTYAVLTPMPYSGGCEVCYKKTSCLSSPFHGQPDAPQA